MKHVLDGCGAWTEEHPEALLKDIYCEKCLIILHERAAQKFVLAYEYLCDVKWQRYEAAFKATKSDVNKKNHEAFREAVSTDMEQKIPIKREMIFLGLTIAALSGII